jgi:hypothetical protein
MFYFANFAPFGGAHRVPFYHFGRDKHAVRKVSRLVFCFPVGCFYCGGVRSVLNPKRFFIVAQKSDIPTQGGGVSLEVCHV